MKAVYETPQISMSECRVQDSFLASAITTPTTAPIIYDDLGGWSPLIPPKH